MECKIIETAILKTAENTINDYLIKGWKLHTFTTSYEGKMYVMVFIK
jgi:hypothetical protein